MRLPIHLFPVQLSKLRLFRRKPKKSNLCFHSNKCLPASSNTSVSCATVQTALVQTQTKKIQPLLPQQQMSSIQYTSVSCATVQTALVQTQTKKIQPLFDST